MRPIKMMAATLALMLLAAACDQGPVVDRLYPGDVYDTKRIGFPQVITVTGGRQVLVSGTVALDTAGALVGGGDVGAQLTQIFENLRRSLAAAGAEPKDVVRLRIFIVDYRAELRPLVIGALDVFYGAGPRATSTLVGVQALARADLLAEVDATAIVD